MSGLFLNFYQIEIDLKEVSVKALNYSDYQSKEATQLSGFFEERDELGFSSKLELYPIDKHSLFGD